MRHVGFSIALFGALGPALWNALWPSLLAPASWQPLLIALGLMPALLVGHWPHRLGLLPFAAAVLFAYAFAWRGQHPQASLAAATALACAFAFTLGLMRSALPRFWVLAGSALALYGALADLLALWPLHADAAHQAHDAIASWFENRHAFAALVLTSLFAHLLYFEKPPASPTRAAPALAGPATAAPPAGLAHLARPHLGFAASGLVTLFALLLSDSRSAQGTFFLLFLPLLFLSVRLDFGEPHPERLIWVAGATLCAGLVWLNLPDRQLHAAAHVFTEPPTAVLKQREAARQSFLQAPAFGHGAGAYPWAVRALLPALTAGSNETGAHGAQPSGRDSLWQQLEAGFDAANDPADLALDDATPPLANSHPLQALAEQGLVGFGLEALCLALALFALFREALRFGTPSARYLGMALLALSLHGLFTPALESPVIRVIYFGLIGYGASYWQVKPAPAWLQSPVFALGAGLAALAAWCSTAWITAQPWRAERLFAGTLASVSDPKAFTDGLVRTLAFNPYHVEAHYAYAQVLVRFGRKVEALGYIDRLARIAPDPPRQDMARASVLVLGGAPQEAARLLTPWLHRRHPPLPALEMVADIYAATGQCEPLGRLLADSARLRAAYPAPEARLFTSSRLQEEFARGEEVNFVQLWFGGRPLRKRYAERRLEAYHRDRDARERLEKVLASGCDDATGQGPKVRATRHRIRQG